jgi:endonuclease/exonuclease/phosphatase (EEP) superfamily protein YafD
MLSRVGWPLPGAECLRVIWALPLLLSLLAPYLSARSSWPLALLTIGFPWLCLANLVAFFGLAVKRRRQALFPLIALLLGIPHWLSFLNWREQSPGGFRILTMNCCYFEATTVGRAKVYRNIEECKPLLLQLHPDVVCAQDFSTSTGAENEQIEDFVKGPMGLSNFIYYFPSMATYSRTPIESHDGVVFPSTYNCFCSSDLRLGGREVRVFNLHLQSYGLGAAGGRIKRLIGGVQARSEQAEIVARAIAASPYPVIVAGDFNDVPTSYVYRRVRGRLLDGFREAGRGVGFTYQGPIPGLRIDYIFCSPELEFSGYRIINAGSCFDHSWVLADMRWR